MKDTPSTLGTFVRCIVVACVYVFAYKLGVLACGCTAFLTTCLYVGHDGRLHEPAFGRHASMWVVVTGHDRLIPHFLRTPF